MRSIREHLTRRLLAVVLGLLIAGVGTVGWLATDEVFDQFDITLDAKVQAVAAIARRTPEGLKVPLNGDLDDEFNGDRADDFYQIWDGDGRELGRSESLRGLGDLPMRTRRADRLDEWNHRLSDGRPVRAVGLRIEARGGEGEMHVVVASLREDLDELILHLVAWTAAWGALLAGVTLWVVPRVLRQGLQPLEALGDQAARIHAASLANRFEIERMPVELRPIAGRLNDLLERLELSFERERRFSADLAHELRTPLSELKTMAEAAMKWPGERDANLDRDVLAATVQMERIVSYILALARGDQGQLVLKTEAVAVDQIVTALLDDLSPRADNRRIRVERSLAPAQGVADLALLRAVLSNLLENGVDYAPFGGELSVMTGMEGVRPWVRISNVAPEVGPDDVPRMFDRFWRKEASRSGGQHLGLGLSLARSFATAMGWSLTASLDRGQVLTFELRGPTGRAG